MKVGDLIKVQTYSGAIVTRRVAADTEDGILICTEDEYSAAEREGRKPLGVGWPTEYIIGAAGKNGAAAA